MKISYNWLQDFITTDLSIEEISEVLTNTGLEVEGSKSFGITKESVDGIVIGEVVSCEQHPNADRLKLTKVDIGAQEPVQIVCGAHNVAQGLKVPVATVGTTLSSPDGSSFKIKKAKLRGEASHGMICSKKEIGVSDDNSGIWALETEATPGTPIYDILNSTADTVFEIGLTPNRADAMSHFGVARDFYAGAKVLNLSASWKDKDYVTATLPNSTNLQVENNVTDIAPRYRAIVIENITVKDSPQWMQDRLKAIGINPKNNVVDVTNYVLHTLGQPLHAFDFEKISDHKIIVRKANEGETLDTLDNQKLKLSTEDLIIADSQKPIALAGVMGGLDSAVSKDTKSVVLECAYFNPVSVRKSAKRHAINSDSSFRFERGIDPNIHTEAIALALGLLNEFANENSTFNSSESISAQGKLPESVQINLRLNKVSKILGSVIPKETIIEILSLLDFDILADTEDTLSLLVPTYRVDVLREIDVIEEIVRIYGYNRISSNKKFSFNLSTNEFDKIYKSENKLATILKNSGFNEAMNASLVNEEHNALFANESDSAVPIINSLSAELSQMPLSLLPGLLKNIAYNFNRKAQAIQLFEFGYTYTKEADTYNQKSTLSIIQSGVNNALWNQPEQDLDIFSLINVVDTLLNNLNIQFDKENIEHPNFSSCVKYTYQNKTLGVCGLINSKLAKIYTIDKPVHYAELNLKNIHSVVELNEATKYEAVSKFPSVERDLALLVGKSVDYRSIVKEVEALDQPIIQSVSLFDIYEGDKIPEDKKSFAIKLKFSNKKETLTDKQIDLIVEQLLKNLKNNHSITLRQ